MRMNTADKIIYAIEFHGFMLLILPTPKGVIKVDIFPSKMLLSKKIRCSRVNKQTVPTCVGTMFFRYWGL